MADTYPKEIRKKDVTHFVLKAVQFLARVSVRDRDLSQKLQKRLDKKFSDKESPYFTPNMHRLLIGYGYNESAKESRGAGVPKHRPNIDRKIIDESYKLIDDYSHSKFLQYLATYGYLAVTAGDMDDYGNSEAQKIFYECTKRVLNRVIDNGLFTRASWRELDVEAEKGAQKHEETREFLTSSEGSVDTGSISSQGSASASVSCQGSAAAASVSRQGSPVAESESMDTAEVSASCQGSAASESENKDATVVSVLGQAPTTTESENKD